MSSRFVSGGTIAGDSGAAAAAATSASASASGPPTSTTTPSSAQTPTSAAWEKAQEQLEADRKAREAARKNAVESGSGQSLYDVLQANKAAKQAAFEEANKIRNQFRALDDDEVDFLEGVAADERRAAEEQRHAEEVRLRAFRDAQRKKDVEPVDDTGNGVLPADEAVVEEWSTAGAARKRKREKEPAIKGIKRRVSEPAKEEAVTNGKEKTESQTEPQRKPSKANGSLLERSSQEASNAKVNPPPAAPAAPAAESKMGLVDYGSDDDDDD